MTPGCARNPVAAPRQQPPGRDCKRPANSVPGTAGAAETRTPVPCRPARLLPVRGPSRTRPRGTGAVIPPGRVCVSARPRGHSVLLEASPGADVWAGVPHADDREHDVHQGRYGAVGV